MDFEAILYGTDFVDRVSGRRGDTAFSIGASLGFVLGSLAGLPPMVCAALGYAAVFGSATNTLLAPVLIGMEVFGVENGLAFFAVCLVAFLVNGRRCIYTAQKRSFW